MFGHLMERGSQPPEPISGAASVRHGFETTVSIRRVNGTVNDGKPFDIFSYPGSGPIPKAYVLSDENANTYLQMTWLSPNHLQVDDRSAT
jgi:hypothetical protein